MLENVSFTPKSYLNVNELRRKKSLLKYQLVEFSKEYGNHGIIYIRTKETVHPSSRSN